MYAQFFFISAPPSNYMEAYLQQRSTSKPGSSFYGQRGLESLRSCILDLMLAGSETTSSALNWSILLLIKYPTIQQRVQNELDTACGTRSGNLQFSPFFSCICSKSHIKIAKWSCNSDPTFAAPIGYQRWRTDQICLSQMQSFMKL